MLCDSPLSDANDSEEHIVINAIGGRYKVSGVLCVQCNNGAGQTWDSALAKDLQSLGLLIGVKRERGVLPSLAVENLDGEQLLLHADGSMSPARASFSQTPESYGSMRIELVARSVEEARKILKGVKRKYSNFDLESAIASAGVQSRYSRSPLSFSMEFGGALSGRSLVKSVLCFAVVNGVVAKDCTNARQYLLEDGAEACFGYWYESDLMLHRPEGVPLHFVAVSNQGTDGQLLGYIEFFGVRRMVVCLAESYSGAAVHASYCIDPRSSERINVEFDLGLDRVDIRASYNYDRIPDGSIERAFDSILRQAVKRSAVKARDQAIDRAVQYAFSNLGVDEGAILTERDVQKLSDLLMHELTPYVTHVIGNRRRRDAR
ncbi:HNH endonuclease [Pseudomonas alloputida]|uniref:HNH endonuclease n=1 Tax=Pseudomonas alloputida TaxID=1940621 RepID=A0AAW7HKN5_9PSED|nr:MULTISPECIES: HNH endonuclease [Pseudomonas]MDM3878268.1 HNH endonuclease [Pseudomonas alloputida]MDM3955131.1 HNH endonuclease [Pseudomonas alloputida]WJR20059.1 HNH endonuclease [Pseudomonas alloputida]WJR58635.1 HNH endonuclease [Pseudomonas kurunegalensis]WJR64858.1 HNH endonuclease [Pseudomonas alloputida]